MIDTSGQDGAADQVIGDNGRVTFNGTETFLPGEEEATLSFNFGAGSNDTTVTGTAGAGPARAGNWNNLQGGGETVFGDDGDEIVSFDDGSFAAGVTVRWGMDLESPAQPPCSGQRHAQLYYAWNRPRSAAVRRLPVRRRQQHGGRGPGGPA